MSKFVAGSDVMIAVVMLINALVLMCNIIVLRMAGQYKERMGKKLRRVIFGWLGRLLCCKFKINPETNFQTRSQNDRTTASKSKERTDCETSYDDTRVTNPELSNAGPNPDPQTLSRADKELLLTLNRLLHPLEEHSVNGSIQESIQEEWQQAARILDRFFGICCFLLMMFTLLCVLVSA